MGGRGGAAARWAAGAGLTLVVGALVYARSTGSYFLGDDFEEILSAGRPAERGVSHDRSRVRILARPTLSLTHDAVGLRPWVFHLENVLLHVTNSVLVGVLALLVVGRIPRLPVSTKRSRLTVAVLAGATFLVLPTHTEAVSWIAGRADLLATLGALACACAWLRPDRTRRWTIGAVVALALGLLAKESAVVVPVVLALLEASTGSGSTGRERLRRAWSTWPLMATLVVYLLWRWQRIGTIFGDYASNDAFDASPGRLVGRAASMVVRTLVPGMTSTAAFVVLAALVAVALVGTLLAAAAVGRADRAALRSAAWLLAGGGAAAGLLALPAAGLGVSLRTTAGERLVYLPSVATAVVVGVALAAACARWRAALAAAAAVLLLAAVVLVDIDGRWAAAGRLSERVYAEPATWDHPRPVTILVEPDNLQGVNVGRNAVGAATELAHSWPPRLATTVAVVTLSRPDDRVVASAGPGPRTWRLRLPDPGTAFVEVVPGGWHWETPGIEVLEEGPHELVVRLSADIDPATVLYVSAGRLLPLDR